MTTSTRPDWWAGGAAQRAAQQRAERFRPAVAAAVRFPEYPGGIRGRGSSPQSSRRSGKRDASAAPAGGLLTVGSLERRAKKLGCAFRETVASAFREGVASVRETVFDVARDAGLVSTEEKVHPHPVNYSAESVFGTGGKNINVSSSTGRKHSSSSPSTRQEHAAYSSSSSSREHAAYSSSSSSREHAAGVAGVHPGPVNYSAESPVFGRATGAKNTDTNASSPKILAAGSSSSTTRREHAGAAKASVCNNRTTSARNATVEAQHLAPENKLSDPVNYSAESPVFGRARLNSVAANSSRGCASAPKNPGPFGDLVDYLCCNKVKCLSVGP